MATLKSLCRISLAAMMVASFDKDEPYQHFIDETLRILPKGTTVTKVTELVTPPQLTRDWIVEYDCPYFLRDFEFEVTFERKILSDGLKLHQYEMATEILPVKGKDNENTDSRL